MVVGILVSVLQRGDRPSGGPLWHVSGLLIVGRTYAVGDRPSALLEDLRCHVDAYTQFGDDGYVFTGVRGGSLAPHVLQTAWADARSRLGLDEVHLHDLRNLAGTLAASTGAGTKELMHRLGRASPQAALRYQQATRSVTYESLRASTSCSAQSA
jgi:integrase